MNLKLGQIHLSVKEVRNALLRQGYGGQAERGMECVKCEIDFGFKPRSRDDTVESAVAARSAGGVFVLENPEGKCHRQHDGQHPGYDMIEGNENVHGSVSPVVNTEQIPADGRIQHNVKLRHAAVPRHGVRQSVGHEVGALARVFHPFALVEVFLALNVLN